MSRCSPLPLLLALLVPGSGCGEARETMEARKLLQRVEAIAEDGPIEARRQQVAALEALPLASEPLRRTRAACVEAHRALLDAEEAQARARRIVEAARPAEAPFGPEQRREADRWLQRAERAIARSREAAPRCEDGLARVRARLRR